MSFSKKLLSGFLAIGLFSGVSSVRALDQIYFSELSEFQKIVMPPGTCDIELATLPSFYRYLQSLFFLTVSNGKEGDDIEGLCALRSYIKFIVVQMKGRGLKEISRNGYFVFAKLIVSIGDLANVIVSENSGDRKTSFKYLEQVLETYKKIDKNALLQKGLEKLNLSEIYNDTKKYVFARCKCYDKFSPNITATTGSYGNLFKSAEFFPFDEVGSFEGYRDFANGVAIHFSDMIKIEAAIRMNYRKVREYWAVVDLDSTSDEQAEKLSATTSECALPIATAEDGTDIDRSRTPVASDESFPLFDLKNFESCDENFGLDVFEREKVSALAELCRGELEKIQKECGK